MDFSGVSKDTAAQVTAGIDRILSSSFSPGEKQKRISLLLRSVGLHYYDTTFSLVSYSLGSEIMKSQSMGSYNSQEERLANKIVRNYALGRTSSAALIGEYYDTVLGRAQSAAFSNARSLQKHPTLTRTLGPKKDCGWCIDKASRSPYINPIGEDFARHDSCDCRIEVSGFRTRNGEVANFKKEKSK